MARAISEVIRVTPLAVCLCVKGGVSQINKKKHSLSKSNFDVCVLVEILEFPFLKILEFPGISRKDFNLWPGLFLR